MTSHLQWYKSFLNGLPYISNTDRTDYCILMQTRNPLLYDLSNSHCLAYSLSHSLQHNFLHLFFLDEGGGVGDVVADEALSGDADLILADGGGLGRRLLHPLVPIHGAFLRRRSRRASGGGGSGGGAAVVGGEVTEGAPVGACKTLEIV